jgi:VWFA-related protein
MFRAYHLGALLPLAGALFAQEAEPVEAGVVIRSTTSLVQVRVVAHDSKGEPAANLQRDDFQIQDDRKPQPITLFVGPQAPSASPSTAESVEASVPTAIAAGYSLILLDWLNTEYSDRVQAQEQVIGLLKKFEPRQSVAIYVLDHEPRLLHDFTSNMPELIQAIEAAGLDPAHMEPDTPGKFDARYGGPTGPRPSVEEQLFYLNNRVTDTFHTLELIADRLAHVPGRKSLIWLSAAFPLVVNGGVIPGAKPAEVVYHQNLERLLARFNRADVAVYGVDAHGLASHGHSYPGTMEQMAERTGGTAFHSRNDLDEGMRLALDDLTVSYTLGFHVPPGARPGLHEIRVRVSRPGIQLRYRESYQLAN